VEDASWRKNLTQSRLQFTTALGEMDKIQNQIVLMHNREQSTDDLEYSYKAAFISLASAKKKYERAQASPNPTSPPHDFTISLALAMVAASILPVFWLKPRIQARIQRWRRSQGESSRAVTFSTRRLGDAGNEKRQ
jgi:hypothetical protein